MSKKAPKIITDRELVEIVRRSVFDGEARIDDQASYSEYLADLSKAVAKQYGGKFERVLSPMDGDGEHAVSIAHDDNVPDNGGIYADFDPGQSWKTGE